MARPFRFQPPSPPAHALSRPRLVAKLAERHTQRLVTIVAGPGFGKTSLLVAAMAEDVGAPHRDVWLSCEPADESEPALIAGLAEAFGLPTDTDLDRILETVWAAAPASICFVLDNVHEVPAGSEGADVLRRLLDDLSANGRLVLSSRDDMPVPTARLAASGQLVRLREADLVYDDAELRAVAATRGIDVSVLGSAGGWPALVELTAAAGTELVLEYLWEEVLAGVGPERARLLAMLAVAGGGDDAIVTALAGEPSRVADLVAGVPLVEKTASGWAVLHPLWGPPLRPLLSDADADDARRRAAYIHRAAERFEAAIDLSVEAEDWTSAVAVMRDVEIRLHPQADRVRWRRALPIEHRQSPPALLAAAVELRTRDPRAALAALSAAAKAFQAAGDVDGEVAAIHQEGLVRWWLSDFAGLFELYGRVRELAATGSTTAQTLDAVGRAAVAHLSGDSDGVFSALAGVDRDATAGWRPVVQWFSSVAHRRNGDLGRAYDDLDVVADLADPQLEIARLRTDWLRGAVDDVCRQLPAMCAHYEGADRYLFVEATLELAAKGAWLGDLATSRDQLEELAYTSADLQSALARFLLLVTSATVAVNEGDEAAAMSLLRDNDEATPGRAESWYWRDRAALALPYVLLPDARAGWAAEPLGRAHQAGLALARALAAARDDDLGEVERLAWPDTGVVRAHLPARWAAELAAAGHAAGNPPPDDLIGAIGTQAHSALHSLAEQGPARLASAARVMQTRVSPGPSYRLRICTIGPLEVWRDGQEVAHADLRRTRVRELLCLLVARRRVRREEAADLLWPELADPGRNLRVTLSYLQRVLQSDRVDGEAPFFLRADAVWLSLAGSDRLSVDAWELDERLDLADAAERANNPTAAVAAYEEALPLWRGEPYADVADSAWVDTERPRLRARYVAAATRAGELLLAAGESTSARAAARHAIRADGAAETAYQLVVRTHLADNDRSGAVRAVDECRTALLELGLEPSLTTLNLIP